VIPCLNEAAAIGGLLRALQAHLSTIVVVDDGCSDNTGQIAQSHGAIVLRHGQTLGKGTAVNTGLSWLRERGFAWAMLMDGDGQHAVEDLPAFWQRWNQTGAPLIVGNRMPKAAGMPWTRRAANRWMSRRLSNLVGRPLPDSQCGFRLLSVAVWSRLTIEARRFEFESELLVRFLRAGARVEFVPIRVIYGTERTKIRPLPDGWRWVRWWWKTGRAWEASNGQRLETTIQALTSNG
jgi:glycosyltransferase involved in cell wall biosynthesis